MNCVAGLLSQLPLMQKSCCRKVCCGLPFSPLWMLSAAQKKKQCSWDSVMIYLSTTARSFSLEEGLLKTSDVQHDLLSAPRLVAFFVINSFDTALHRCNFHCSALSSCKTLSFRGASRHSWIADDCIGKCHEGQWRNLIQSPGPWKEVCLLCVWQAKANDTF